jgi:hypothetical protein
MFTAEVGQRDIDIAGWNAAAASLGTQVTLLTYTTGAGHYADVNMAEELTMKRQPQTCAHSAGPGGPMFRPAAARRYPL